MAERDLDEVLKRMSQTPVSRRSFLYAAGLSGAAAALAACTGGTAASTAPSTAASAGASAGAATPLPSYEIEKQLFMYNWSEYISLKNIEEFKKRYGVTKFQYDIYDNNEAMLAKLQAGGTGYDIASPSSYFVPAMIEGGYVEKLDMSRIPNFANIDPKFKGTWSDPNDEYQIPKDWGTTGILYRSSLIPSVPKTWKDFYDLVKGPASGKTVFVDSIDDVLIFPLKMLGFSLNSVEKDELDQARTILLDVAPHILALDSNKYGDKMATGEASVALGWTGPLIQDLADTPDKGYVVPEEGTAFWLDTWVMLKDAPNPNAAYAWLDFIHEPDIQAEETNYNYYATPNTKAKPLVLPEILNDVAVFPTDEQFAKLEPQLDTSASTQRRDIWDEFKQTTAN